MDEKTFMDKYMAAFSKFTDAQAKGEDVNQVFADMKKNMPGAMTDKELDFMSNKDRYPVDKSGPVSDKELEFMNKMADPGPSADYTTGPIEIPEGVDPSMFNEIPTTKEDMGSLPGPVSDRDMQFMQKTMPQAVSPMGSMINNVEDFLSNLGRKVGK
tara:strand:+ start:17522 stop:17992 length:471 start_codon:yes stop_codon:yes gene_type:complete